MFWKLFLVAAALAAAYYRWSRRKIYRLAAEIPPVPNTSYPIIGHGYTFMGSSEDRMKTFQDHGRLANQQGGLVSWWMANRFFISITDPTAIAVLSKACLDKDEFLMKYMRVAIGNGSIFAPVNIWHPRRKINTPFFNLKNLSKIVPVFDQESSIMVDLMRAEVGRDFSIWNYITTFSFDTVCVTSTGSKVNSQENPEHCLLQAIDQGTHLIGTRMLIPWLHPDFVYHRLPVHEELQRHLRCFFAFVDEVIYKKRNEAEENEIVDENKWTKFLDAIIQSSGGMKDGYSDEELREEIMVMMIAGTDTSATAACFTAVLLSRYPEVQDKVHEELHAIFEDSDRPFTTEDLPHLKYLEAVIKESLRLYPPVPVVTREIHKDIVLPSGPTLVDGTSVMFNIWGTHRNPAYWGADAEEFRPERFLEGVLKHPAQFVPFSYSVRNCLGATYAMMSVKTALANLLRRYRLLPPTGARAEDLKRPLAVKFDIMMKAVDGFMVRVEEKKTKN